MCRVWSVIRVLVRGLGLMVGGLALVGCNMTNLPLAVPTNKNATLISVDRDKGVVTMGASYIYLEKPTVDWGQARTDAIAECLTWMGFENAEPVGRTRRQCTKHMGSDCVTFSLVGDYRCVP